MWQQSKNTTSVASGGWAMLAELRGLSQHLVWGRGSEAQHQVSWGATLQKLPDRDTKEQMYMHKISGEYIQMNLLIIIIKVLYPIL